ncbi:MAG TPA: rhomboid family intramembrane serine protease [Phycisphaerae bacterium]|nr:rhomboid family intramembrane serine protease [Phycisphaerae bacterium]
MLVFAPVRTDSPVRRTPWVNYALIALNVVIFLATDVVDDLSGRSVGEHFKSRYVLDPGALELHQFFTYQFLHGGVGHLLGNMLFLWVFGNSINAKMGQLPYLFFYLASGVFAGVGFVKTTHNPCLGASGSIAGVTTAYLVLFPRANVTVFYWLWFYLGTMQIQALLLIGVKVILWDNVLAPQLSGGGYTEVAYSAHIAGYVFGFVWCALMLLVRALPRDQYDVIALVRRAYQRQQFRQAMSDPNSAARAQFGRVARPITEYDTPAPATVTETERIRMEIGELLGSRDYESAAIKYQELIARDPAQCLSRRSMLDVANQLMIMSRYPQAAAAYEKYLKAYPSDSEVNQVKLLLGIIYAKYLHQYESARRYLRECTSRLNNPDQLAQANHWLDEADSALGGAGTAT